MVNQYPLINRNGQGGSSRGTAPARGWLTRNQDQVNYGYDE